MGLMHGNQRRNYETYKGVKRMNYAIRAEERRRKSDNHLYDNETGVTDEDMEVFYLGYMVLFLVVVVVSVFIYLLGGCF